MTTALRTITILQRSFALRDRFEPGQVLSAQDAEEFNHWQGARFRERLKKWVYALADGEITEQELELKEQAIREELAEGRGRRQARSAPGTLVAETMACAREHLGAQGADLTQAERLERIWKLYHDPVVQREARRRFEAKQRGAQRALASLGQGEDA